jgi:hypothetical protein
MNTSEILSFIRRLESEKQQGLSGNQDSYILQRYLDELTSYAETAYQESMVDIEENLHSPPSTNIDTSAVSERPVDSSGKFDTSIGPTQVTVNPEMPPPVGNNIGKPKKPFRPPLRKKFSWEDDPDSDDNLSFLNQDTQSKYETKRLPGPLPYPDESNFSPSPVLRNPPPNVPPTHEQREANLESGRLAALGSNDVEVQLAWAQDALSYVEVAMQNEQRMSIVQPPRPQSPQVEHRLKVDAVNMVMFLADQNHPRAEFIKGMWLEFGKFGFRVDKKEAFRCYARAAEQGYARAEYRMGILSSNEPLNAINHYKRGVSMGDSASHYVRLSVRAV